MGSLYLMPIFIMLCIAFVPVCILSSELRNEKRNATTVRNTQGSTSKFHDVQPRKHASRNKRPAIYIKERGPVNLTRWPTNSEKVRLFGRVGLFLYVNANGTISGSLNQHSKFVKFELQSFGPSIVRVRSIETGKFLAITSKGTLQTRTNCMRYFGTKKKTSSMRMKLMNADQRKSYLRGTTDDCLFYQNHEQNLFVSFASFKYYMKEHYDMFLSIKRNGEVKQPTSTLPGQDSIQFIALNVDNWRPAGMGTFGG